MNMPLISRLTPLLLAACATPYAAVPEALAPARGEQFALTVAARGVQVYECRTGNSGAAARWVFVAPEAELLDAQGRKVGSHGAGPHWLAEDGSRLQGSVKARSDAPRAGDIPWLLLATTSSGPQGAFTGVTSIQRVRTHGGVAPEGPCEAEGVARVPYTADYRLFRAASASPATASLASGR
jgi:hypothetical protein